MTLTRSQPRAGDLWQGAGHLSRTGVIRASGQVGSPLVIRPYALPRHTLGPLRKGRRRETWPRIPSSDQWSLGGCQFGIGPVFSDIKRLSRTVDHWSTLDHSRAPG